ncbi:apyrase [Episyrphus balteatus]|uniref:apyrase n=1 Tax=Episyrphus balteatus TaxID=286459 RepID=UPI0024853946|nr:apyrase [Episyrphus balteatus]
MNHPNSHNHRYTKLSSSEILSASPTSTANSSVMYTRDWRTALRSPPTYRLGNRTFRFNYHFALLITATLSLGLVFFYMKTKSTSSFDVLSTQPVFSRNTYNTTYPLTPPKFARGIQTYRIGMVADLDTASKSGNSWKSYFKKGHLTFIEAKREVKITWDEQEPQTLESSFSLKDRGMELSELVTFDGKLLSFDDRTGLVYKLENDKLIPWVILLDGDGQSSKGFKSEWATVKNQILYVGSMGKEWTTSQGDFENENPMYVKIISPGGEVRSLNWSFNYKTMREESMNIVWPGYMIHESGVWSDAHQKWFFLPRRCSKNKYNETRDEHMGCNVLIMADDRFSKIETITLENKEPTHGFSSFKFIPGCDDKYILAIKSEELNGKTSTFITVFDIEGNVLYPEQRIPTDFKYEGIEFI